MLSLFPPVMCRVVSCILSLHRYDENPKCEYSDTRLNVAIHVRMGDRREFQDGSLGYFQLLDLLMDKFSLEVVGKGLEQPLFHIFSETVIPCPPEHTGLFEEFPTWPVELDQVGPPIKRLFLYLSTCATVASTRNFDGLPLQFTHNPRVETSQRGDCG